MNWRWPSNWPAEWPPGIRAGQMSAQTKDTEAFVAFYQDITAAIEEKVASGTVSDDEANLLRFLYFGFWREYKPSWQASPISGILLRLQTRASKPLQVSCQAFLHMAYDLPRVIANALTANPSLGMNSRDMEDTYFQMDDLFDEPLKAQFKSFRSVGIFALPAKLMGRFFPLAGIAAVWVRDIRARSFRNALTLARAQLVNLETRERIEGDLKLAVIAAIDEVLKHRLNPALWFTFLRSPSIAVPSIAFPILLALAISDGPVTGVAPHTALWVKLAIAASSSILAYLIAAFWGLMRLVTEAGRKVADAVERVMRNAELELPGISSEFE